MQRPSSSTSTSTMTGLHARATSSGLGETTTSTSLGMAAWRQRVLGSFTRLGDHDAQRSAVEQLAREVEELDAATLPAFVSILVETAADTRVSTCREALRLMAITSACHKDALSPLLPKIVLAVVKRLRNGESGGAVRDTCAEALGIISRYVPPLGSGPVDPNATLNPESTMPGPPGALGIFFKPLFALFTDQDKGIQTGAGQCIAAVIENSRADLVAADLPMLARAIAGRLGLPTTHAPAAVLAAAARLVDRTAEACIPHVEALVRSALPHLRSSDWQARKGAADFLAACAYRLGPAMGSHRKEVLDGLVPCKFDKVPPAREAIAAAIDAYQDLLETLRQRQSAQSSSLAAQQQLSATTAAALRNARARPASVLLSRTALSATQAAATMRARSSSVAQSHSSRPPDFELVLDAPQQPMGPPSRPARADPRVELYLPRSRQVPGADDAAAAEPLRYDDGAPPFAVPQTTPEIPASDDNARVGLGEAEAARRSSSFAEGERVSHERRGSSVVAPEVSQATAVVRDRLDAIEGRVRELGSRDSSEAVRELDARVGAVAAEARQAGQEARETVALLREEVERLRRRADEADAAAARTPRTDPQVQQAIAALGDRDTEQATLFSSMDTRIRAMEEYRERAESRVDEYRARLDKSDKDRVLLARAVEAEKAARQAAESALSNVLARLQALEESAAKSAADTGARDSAMAKSAARAKAVEAALAKSDARSREVGDSLGALAGRVDAIEQRVAGLEAAARGVGEQSARVEHLEAALPDLDERLAASDAVQAATDRRLQAVECELREREASEAPAAAARDQRIQRLEEARALSEPGVQSLRDVVRALGDRLEALQRTGAELRTSFEARVSETSDALGELATRVRGLEEGLADASAALEDRTKPLGDLETLRARVERCEAAAAGAEGAREMSATTGALARAFDTLNEEQHAARVELERLAASVDASREELRRAVDRSTACQNLLEEHQTQIAALRTRAEAEGRAGEAAEAADAVREAVARVEAVEEAQHASAIDAEAAWRAAKRRLASSEIAARSLAQHVKLLGERLERFEGNANARGAGSAGAAGQGGCQDQRILAGDAGTPRGVWEQALALTSVGHLERAYRNVIEYGDALLLLRLMELTGPCLDRLEEATRLALFRAVTPHITNGKHTAILIRWVDQELQLEPMPPPHTQGLMKARSPPRLPLRVLEAAAAMPNEAGEQAARALAAMREKWAPFIAQASPRLSSPSSRRAQGSAGTPLRREPLDGQ
eukprot:m51a1_g10229 putative microtubule-associated protein tortifolia1-like (1260) ;mRNA; f:154388-159015